MYLRNRDVVRIDGSDALDFIHKLCTSNIKEMQKGDAKYTCILSPQSRFLCDFFIYYDGASMLIDVNHKFTEMLISKLKFYKMRANIDISNTDFKIITEEQECIGGNRIVGSYSDPRSKALPPRIILAGIENLEDGSTRYNDLLIDHSIVDGIWLEEDKAFILEYGFDKINAVDRNKGCYIGQELITRTQCTGIIRKSVRLITIATGGVASDVKDILQKNNKYIIFNNTKIGHIITMNNSGTKGLILIKDEYSSNAITINSIIFNIL